MNNNYNNDSWVQKALWEKKKTLSEQTMLDEVLEIIDNLYGKRTDDEYSQALDDVKQKLREYFS